MELLDTYYLQVFFHPVLPKTKKFVNLVHNEVFFGSVLRKLETDENKSLCI